MELVVVVVLPRRAVAHQHQHQHQHHSTIVLEAVLIACQCAGGVALEVLLAFTTKLQGRIVRPLVAVVVVVGQRRRHQQQVVVVRQWQDRGAKDDKVEEGIALSAMATSSSSTPDGKANFGSHLWAVI